MKAFGLLSLLLIPLGVVSRPGAQATTMVPVSDSHIFYSPYNWYQSGSAYAQSPNPGAYLKVGFTGTKVGVNVDVSPLTNAKVPAAQYPVVRYSVDHGPAVTIQLTPETSSLSCATGLRAGNHTLRLEYVAGYVFLDFWSPVNVMRVTGLTLDEGAKTVAPADRLPLNALFLGDSITNGDDNTATFAGGITNAVDTQDATQGYPAIVAAGIGTEYGIVAYGGASWDRTAADGNTPGLMTFHSMLDKVHSRLVDGKFSPVPDDIFVNMGENAGPSEDQVPKLLASLRAASGAKTNIFLMIPFSGRARASLSAGFSDYRKAAPSDSQTHLLDLGDSPYLKLAGPTMYSVDGQHPLVSHHAILGAQLIQARARKLQGP